MTTINGANYAVPEDDFPTRYDAGAPRIVNRRKQEVYSRALGDFDFADRVRENTDQLERTGKLHRRCGGPRDDR